MKDFDDFFDKNIHFEEEEEEQPGTLLEAILCNDKTAVEEFAKDEVQLNCFCENYDNKTPLVIAVENGNWEIIKILLDAGANPYFGEDNNAHIDYSQFPFTIAANKALQPEYDAMIVTVLRESCRKHPEDYADEICWNLMCMDNGCRNYCGNLPRFVRDNIINCGMNVNMRDKKKNTPLLAILTQHHLIKSDDEPYLGVRLLLDKGADPNACNATGWTPLAKALFMHLNWFDNNYEGDYGYTGVVKMLLEHGADFGYALYCNVENGKWILDRMKANAREDNLQRIMNLLFAKYNSVQNNLSN